MGHIARRLLLTALVLLAVQTLGTGVAGAHASVLVTSPADNTAVAPAPATATVTFTERVTIGVGGLTVRNTTGLRVDSGPSKVDDIGTTVSVGLQTALPDGTYVATYRVLSADGHPVSGSFLFGIGLLVVAWNFGRSISHGAKAGPDPWRGNTLEWFTPSPPPANNFDVVPEVRSLEPMQDIRAELERSSKNSG